MKVQSINVLLAVVGCLSPELAQAKVSTSHTIQCSTSFGSKSKSSVPRHTSTSTSHATATATVTKTPTTTTTPATVTETATTTKVTTSTTTLAQNTDTITSTVVDTATSTATADTSTSTAVTTSTSTTTTTSTSTVATPAGFTPISDSLGSGSSANKVRRALEARATTRSKPTATKYPEEVECEKIYFKTSTTTTTSTASTDTVTASAPSTTTTDTVTNTVTSTTQPGDASTTVTTTSTVTNTVTSTPSTTVTSTATATQTVAAPQQTYYAQCADNNQADSYDGEDINFIYGDGDYYYNDYITDAYDCCVSCAQDDTCGASAYDATHGFCLNIDTCSTCPNGQSAQYTAALGGGPAEVVSNGNCGSIS